MTTKLVERDERTVAIENASYRLAYLILSFGLLLSTMYRSFFRHEASWDLLGLVLLGGAVTTLYRQNYRALPRRWLLVSLSAMALAAALAAIIAFAVRNS